MEVDGEGHGYPEQETHDAARDRWLRARGVRVFRVPASDILDDEALAGVVGEIERLASCPRQQRE